ncbi:MAG: hypothetical protein P8127_08075 [Acidobacteriota bacterium]
MKIAIAAVGLILVLAVSSPDEDSFDRWAKKAMVDESGSGLDNAKGKALATQANWTADYHDDVLWATVEAHQGGKRHRYLGVLWM